jgi:GT2 family glycosyltransferase
MSDLTGTSPRSERDRRPPVVGIVVITWNNLADTLECMQSIASLAYDAKDVILVDNGSTDSSVPIVRDRFPGLRIIETGTNLGVAGGYNAGIQDALAREAEYILILNNDTTVAPDLLIRLVEVAVAKPDAAILMPKVLRYDEPDVIWSAGARYRRFPPAIVFRDRNRRESELTELPTSIAFAPACGLLIARRAFEDVGLFDPGYFFFYEDWDFCERVRAAGRAILYVPSARMWHKVSRTTRRSPELYWRVWGESSARFYRSYGGPAILSIPLHIGYLVAREAVQGNLRALPTFLSGVAAGLRRPIQPAPRLRLPSPLVDASAPRRSDGE